jgi:hypothetical protein
MQGGLSRIVLPALEVQIKEESVVLFELVEVEVEGEFQGLVLEFLDGKVEGGELGVVQTI